jgi:hypothetical protein
MAMTLCLSAFLLVRFCLSRSNAYGLPARLLEILLVLAEMRIGINIGIPGTTSVIAGAPAPPADINVLDSVGTVYGVSFSVLSSTGTSYTVSSTVLSSNGTAYVV